MEELVSARIFLTSKWCRHNFFRAVYAFFSVIHVEYFFLTAKALQEFFSQIFHSSPQRSNGPPIRRTYKTFKKSRVTPVLQQGSHSIIAMDA